MLVALNILCQEQLNAFGNDRVAWINSMLLVLSHRGKYGLIALNVATVAFQTLSNKLKRLSLCSELLYGSAVSSGVFGTGSAVGPVQRAPIAAAAKP